MTPRVSYEVLELRGVGEEKRWCPERRCWIRKRDCLIAERFFGYRWLACTPHADFCKNRFHWVLTAPGDPVGNAHVLEPDTRVPNYSTDVLEAIEVARMAGLDSIPVFPTNREMAHAVCAAALAEAPSEP